MIGERLRLYRESQKLTQNEFSDFLGIKQQSLSKYENNIQSIPDDVKILLHQKGVNINWLLTGEGEMYTGSAAIKGPSAALRFSESPAVKGDKPAIKVNPRDRLEGVQLRGKDIRSITIDDFENRDEIVFVPFYDQQASAGIGTDIEGYLSEKPVPIIKRFLVPYNIASVRALEVRGDSMTKIGLFHEDIVFFVSVDDPGDGVYVISINNKLFVKRVEFDPLGERIRIISENDSYEPRVFTGESISEVKVEGKVIGWIHKHPY